MCNHNYNECTSGVVRLLKVLLKTCVTAMQACCRGTPLAQHDFVNTCAPLEQLLRMSIPVRFRVLTSLLYTSATHYPFTMPSRRPLCPTAPFTLCHLSHPRPLRCRALRSARTCRNQTCPPVRPRKMLPTKMQAKQSRSFFCTLVLHLGAAVVCAILTPPPVSVRGLHAEQVGHRAACFAG